MPDPHPNISDAEFAILKHLWATGPSTVRDLHRATPDRAYTTVQTLLARLEEKGFVSVDRGGHAHVFAASVSREEMLDRSLDEIADRICDGHSSPLVLRLVQKGSWNKEDLDHFRRILDQHRGAD